MIETLEIFKWLKEKGIPDEKCSKHSIAGWVLYNSEFKKLKKVKNTFQKT